MTMVLTFTRGNEESATKGVRVAQRRMQRSARVFASAREAHQAVHAAGSPRGYGGTRDRRAMS